jgi:hypothetical protein
LRPRVQCKIKHYRQYHVACSFYSTFNWG